MKEQCHYSPSMPLVDAREWESLDTLSEKYNKLSSPSIVAKAGVKAAQVVPDSIKKIAQNVGQSISEQELFAQMMKIVATGFKVIEEQAVKFSISEVSTLKKMNQYSTNRTLTQIEEICLLRSYDIAKLISKYKGQDIFAAAIEGGGTGYLGFWGLPFNIVLSTFLYFRAVQSIAMFYGYNVKDDEAELAIASEVFINALSPASDDMNNELAVVVGKVMIMGKAAVVKQAAGKSWAEMARRGGIPLLLTQMRALAHKSAQKALQTVGKSGLEKNLFAEAMEQIGRKLTLKSVGKMIPVASAAISALIDTAQMKKVLDFADIFYQKRFILEKESRIQKLIGDNLDEDSEVIEIEISKEEIMQSNL